MEEKVVVYFALFIVGSRGLQFSLDKYVPTIPGTRPVCGVLRCVEEGSPGHNATPQSPVLGQSGLTFTPSTIFSMSIFRKSKPAHNKNNTRNEATDLIASVSTQAPHLTKVANSIKIDGSLTAAGATLRLELFKQDDCREDFSCQVQAVDVKGRELLSISNMLQQPEKERTSGNDIDKALSTLAQLVTQLDARLATIERYDDTTNHLENKLENLERLLTNKTEQLESKIELIDESVRRVIGNQLENQTECSDGIMSGGSSATLGSLHDKLLSLERLLDKAGEDPSPYEISPFETDLPAENHTSNAGEEIVQHENVSDIYGPIHDPSVVAGISEAFQSLKKHIEQIDIIDCPTQTRDLIKNYMNELQNDFANTTSVLVRDVKEKMHDAVLNSTRHEDTSRNFRRAVTLLFDSFNESFTQVMSVISTTATETKDYCHSLLIQHDTKNESSVRATLESALTDILSPKVCRQGMLSVLPLKSFPYPIVYPGDGLGGPYLCDTVTEGGGWIIIQRRYTETTNFYRNWADYKQGFGSFDTNFWLGNENIYAITSRGIYELRVELAYKGTIAFAHYSSFSVDDEKHNYTLHLGVYSGTAGDSLSDHNGKPFSTYDRDNDGHTANCAERYFGAWWYHSCHSSNLNGLWKEGASRGPKWSTFSSTDAVSFSEMKIRKAT